MNNLEKHVKNNFDGMLVVGDIHAMFDHYSSAVDFADSNGLFFLSLGDLVDRGNYPFEVISDMFSRMKEGRAGLCIGNHDDKFRRYHHGSKVRFSFEAKRTMETVGDERMPDFLKMYADVVEMPVMSNFFHSFDEYIFTHAASHPCIWESNSRIGNTARSRMLYGETNGEFYDDGYPVRLYNWIDEIPMGRVVVVGHDRMPIHNVPISVPLTKNNANGGKAVFIDTGCGKGGHLTGAVFSFRKKTKFEEFKEFR